MKSKKRKSPISLPVVVMILVGLVVGSSLYYALNQSKVTILVPKSDIPVHHKVTADMFETKSVNQNSVAAGAITDKSENTIIGSVTATKLIKGVEIVPGDFLQKDVKSSLTASAPKDNVLVSVSMDAIRGVSASLTSNDHVDIYTTVSADSIGTMTKLIMQNVQVVDVTKKAGEVKSVTFAVTPKQAEELIYADKLGEIHLAVVPYGYKEVTTDGMSDSQFIKEHLNNAGAVDSGMSIVKPSSDTTTTNGTQSSQNAPASK